MLNFPLFFVSVFPERIFNLLSDVWLREVEIKSFRYEALDKSKYTRVAVMLPQLRPCQRIYLQIDRLFLVFSFNLSFDHSFPFVRVVYSSGSLLFVFPIFLTIISHYTFAYTSFDGIILIIEHVQNST